MTCQHQTIKYQFGYFCSASGITVSAGVCTACNGINPPQRQQQSKKLDAYEKLPDCAACNGTGKIGEVYCSDCKSTGKLLPKCSSCGGL